MILSLDDIAKQYEGKPVLRRCSFTFERRGIHVLMGSNGSGKSTLLRIMALLEAPDSGAVLYRQPDRILAQDLDLRRRITLVLSRTGVFNTTVFRNVAYGLKIRGIHSAYLEERVVKALGHVGLDGQRDQRALTLSSGETQRLGLARALVIEPDILFLDEPTASIDDENTAIIESIILGLKNEKRTMVVMTTHDKDQAERLADRLIMLKNGVLEAVK